jgi:hypothetical protein
VVEVVFAMIDHSDIRNRIIVIRRELPLTIGAGSVRRLTNHRGFSFPCTTSTTTHTASLTFSLQRKSTLSSPLQGLLLRCFYFYADGPDKT